MTSATTLEALLAAASVQPAVHDLGPDCIALLFIVDALGPEAVAPATDAGEDLERRLRAVDPAVETARRLNAAPDARRRTSP